MRANRDWLLETNSPDEDSENDRDIQRVWTRRLIGYAAAHVRRWPHVIRQEPVFDILESFSDEAFIDAAAAFVVQRDLRLTEGDASDRAHLLSVRQALWTRLTETPHWRSHFWSSRDGMEMHLKELISTFFMRLSYGFEGGQSYTKGLSDSELTPFLPLLSEISSAAPSCPTIARLYLEIPECLEPSAVEEPLVVTAERWTK